MHPKDTDALKTWLTVKLRPLCDADPLALAKYVFALIRKDKPTDTLREMCIDQLEVFLGRETLDFVSELFHVLENGVPDMKEAADLLESASDSDESLEKKSEKVKITRGKKSTTEDLKYSELDDEDRDFKRARKEEDNEGKPTISPITFPSTNSTGLLKRKRAIEEGRNLPRKTSRIRPPPLLPDVAKYVPSNPHPPHAAIVMEKKQRCKDYDEKGFCLLGENCPYDHGLDPLVVEGGGFPPPPLNVPSTFLPPPVPPQYFMVPPPPSLMPQPMNMPPGLPAVSVDTDATGYNPEQPALSLTTIPSTTPLLNITTNVSSPALYTPAVSTTVSTQSGERPRMSRSQRTGGYYHRTPQEPTNTLVLRKVPPELNVLSKLNSHFDQFGKIVNLKVGFQNDSEAALVQFSTVDEAKAAHNSSSAVLGNRFIRVYYMRTQKYQSVTPNAMSINNICEQDKANDDSSEVSSSNIVEEKPTAGNPDDLPNGQLEVSTTTDDNIALPNKVITDVPPAQQQQQNIAKQLPTSPTLTRPISAELIVKQKELHAKMKALLDDQLKQQKVLIAKLENGRKTMTADEKKKLMEMVKTLSTNNTKLKSQILHQQAQVKAPLKESAPVKTVEKPPVPVSADPPKKPLDLRSKLRKRTREVVVYNVTPEMKEQLTGMFEKLGGLVQVRYDPLSNSDVIFTFKTQVDAKKAVDNCSVLNNKPLIMKWYYPKEEPVSRGGVLKERRMSSQNTTELQSPLGTDDPTLLAETIDFPDDDEDEDSEERSWKR